MDNRTYYIYRNRYREENLMTVGEVKNMFKNQYADVEYYRKHV